MLQMKRGKNDEVKEKKAEDEVNKEVECLDGTEEEEEKELK